VQREDTPRRYEIETHAQAPPPALSALAHWSTLAGPHEENTAMNSMNARSTAVLGMIFMLGAACSGAQRAPAASAAEGEREASAEKPAAIADEYQRVKLRFQDPRFQEMLGHTSYAALHTGEKSVEQIRTLFVDMKGSGSFDFDASVRAAGGIEQYKGRIASYLTSEDVMARGTAALALAVVGDPKYAEPLVTLLRSRLGAHSESLEGYDRGMAMMALALLKATEHRAEIEGYKSSPLKNESEGALAALELMDH
jgi:hypothetical protein